MHDERTLERWFRLEMAQVQQALVRNPVPLQDLLGSQDPKASTRGGEPYRFDAPSLRRLAERLSALTRANLKVPILFYLDREAPGDCFVSDAAQAQALRELSLLKATARGDRHWLSEPLAREFSRNYPTLAQFVLM